MKQKVLEFMREKDRILFELTNLHIFDEELFNATISEEVCANFVDKIIAVQENIFNSDICPWCSDYRCYYCLFGEKYGICDEDDEELPLYQKVYTEVPSFIDAPGMIEAVRRLLK